MISTQLFFFSLSLAFSLSSPTSSSCFWPPPFLGLSSFPLPTLFLPPPPPPQLSFGLLLLRPRTRKGVPGGLLPQQEDLLLYQRQGSFEESQRSPYVKPSRLAKKTRTRPTDTCRYLQRHGLAVWCGRKSFHSCSFLLCQPASLSLSHLMKTASEVRRVLSSIVHSSFLFLSDGPSQMRVCLCVREYIHCISLASFLLLFLFLLLTYYSTLPSFSLSLIPFLSRPTVRCPRSFVVALCLSSK